MKLWLNSTRKISYADSALPLLDRYDGSKKRVSSPLGLLRKAEYCEIFRKREEFGEEVHRLNEYGSAVPFATLKQTRQGTQAVSLNLGEHINCELTETECLSIRIGLMPLSTDVQEVENELEGCRSTFSSTVCETGQGTDVLKRRTA